MVSTIVRAGAAVAAAAVSLLLGFVALSVQDTQSIATVRSALVVTGADEATPVLRLLRGEAEQREANFYRLRADPTGVTPVRTLAPIVGDRAAFEQAFPAGHYARFDTGLTTELGPLRGSANGGYLSTLSGSELQEVATELAAAGVDAQVQELGWWTLFRYMVGYTPAVLAAVVALSGAFLSGFAFAASSAQQLAVRRIFGERAPFGRDLAISGAASVCAFVVTGGAAAVFMHGYNGGHRSGSYFAISGVLLAALMATAMLGACLSGALPARLRFRPALTAWRPWSRGRISIAAAQVLTVTVVVFLFTQAVVSWSELHAVRTSQRAWAGCGGCVTTVFQGYDGPAVLDESVVPFASAVRSLDPTGGVVLSWVPGSRRGDRYTPDDPGSNIIIANRAFIARSEGRLPDPLEGRDRPGRWGLLVPEDHSGEAEAVAAAWQDRFRNPLGSVPDRAEPAPPQIATYPPGSVFNYGRTDRRSEAFSESPVIVVVPAAAGLLDDDSYFAAGTAGDLLFTVGRAATERTLTASGVPRSAFLLDTLAVQMRRGIAAAAQRAPIASIGAIVGMLTVFGLLLVRTRAYTVAARDRILVGVAEGWSPYRLHARSVLQTLALITCAGGGVLLGMRSGLTGPDIVPSVLAVTYTITGTIVFGVSMAVTVRRTSIRELMQHAR